MNIFKASRQWAERPADERFWSLADMELACKAYADSSVQSTVDYHDLRVEAREGEIALLGKNNIPAKLTHYSFGQLAQRVHAPAEYLRNLPATLACQNLNHGLANREETGNAKLLLHKNGEYIARCLTGENYSRIWNWEIANRLKYMSEAGWRTPPARPCKCRTDQIRTATEMDVLRGGSLGLSIKVGDAIGPAGIYASDRDMFVFLIDDTHVISNPQAPSVPLARGFFLWNSEVGDRSFGVMAFLYESVCGNHIVWGAQHVREFRLRHVGTARTRAFYQLKCELEEYADSSVSDEEARIVKAQSFELGTTKEETIDALLKFVTRQRIPLLNETNMGDAYDIAEKTPRYGRPNTPWAITQGLTELSQETEYQNRRVEMDRSAGKLLEIAF